jgi:hypothetical protein
MTEVLSPDGMRTARPRASLVSTVAAAVFAALVAAALFVAAAAAALIGLIVAMAAIVLRLSPRRRSPQAGEVLEGRRTAEGWVVEAAAPR